MEISRTPGLKEFTVEDLKLATNNFSIVLGKGAFWTVYKGWVNEKTLAPSKSEIGMAVAIKIPIYSNRDSQDFEQWQNYNVKLSNFGLAIRGPYDEELPVTSSILTTTDNTQIACTFGYCAPKYLLTGKVCIKSDVYSFGVVLLELLTGLKLIDDNRPDREQSLVHWLEPKLSNKINLETIMDVHMKGQYSITIAFQAAELAKKCLDLNPENRPNMRQVMEELKQIKAMEEETKKL